MKENQFGVSLSQIQGCLTKTISSPRCFVKSCHELSNFLAAHSKLNIEKCILSQSKGRRFEIFQSFFVMSITFDLHKI